MNFFIYSKIFVFSENFHIFKCFCMHNFKKLTKYFNNVSAKRKVCFASFKFIFILFVNFKARYFKFNLVFLNAFCIFTQKSHNGTKV